MLFAHQNSMAQHKLTGGLDEYYSALSWQQNGFFDIALQEQDPNPFRLWELVESYDYQQTLSLTATDRLARQRYYELFQETYPTGNYSLDLQLDIAHRHFQNKTYKLAERSYLKALDVDQDSTFHEKIYYWLAEISILEKNNNQARSYLLTLADEQPDSKYAPFALYGRGALYLIDQQYESATKAFELLKNRYPNEDITRSIGTALGESYYQERRFKDAIQALKSALSYLKGENESKAVYLIAESYNYLDDFKNATSSYLRYINLTEGTRKADFAHYGLGWIYHKQQIYHWAAESFGKAFAGNDTLSRKALYYKAINEKLSGRYPLAMKTFEKFGEEFKTGFWVEHAYYEWAVTSYEMGDYSQTINILLKVVRSGQTLEEPGKFYSLLGEAYYANGEYTFAIEAFEEAEKVSDLDENIKIQARFQKGWVLYRNQAFKQAQPIFQNIYDEFPNSSLAGESLFWSADAFYRLEDYGPARVRFQRFIDAFPNHKLVGAANYSLGWAHFKMRDYEKAVDPLRNFLENYDAPPIALFPYDTDTQLRLGDALYAIENYDDAISYYEKAIGAEPGGDYAMFQIANSYYRDGRTYEAVTTFRKLLRIYPFTRVREQAQYNVSYIYFLMGNYTQAIEEFNAVIDNYPRTDWAARAQYNIGDAYYNVSQYQDAIQAYKKVLDNYPRSSYIIDAVNGIQFAQFASGQADSSGYMLEELVQNHPNQRTADRLRYRMATNLLQSGDYNGAVSAFEDYIRKTPYSSNLPDAYYNLAEAYRLNDKEQKSIESYKYLLERFPQSDRAPTAHSDLADIYVRRGELDQALEQYRQLRDNFNDYRIEGIVGMGRINRMNGDLSKARELYEEGLSIDAENTALTLGIAALNVEERRFDEALENLRPIAENSSNENGAEAQYLIGEVFRAQGNYNQAIDAYTNVKLFYEAYQNWVAKALFGSAKCYEQLGNPGEANNTLRTIVESYPETIEAIQAQQMLNQQN